MSSLGLAGPGSLKRTCSRRIPEGMAASIRTGGDAVTATIRRLRMTDARIDSMRDDATDRHDRSRAFGPLHGDIIRVEIDSEIPSRIRERGA